MFSPAFAYSPDIILVRYSCSLISEAKAATRSGVMDGETSLLQLISTHICVLELRQHTHSSSARPLQGDGRSKPPFSSHLAAVKPSEAFMRMIFPAAVVSSLPLKTAFS